MTNNGYFKKDDPTVSVVGGMELLPSWWSRPYEYAWAKQFIVPGETVADMGCGWSGRPFKEELADGGCEVYAIDGDVRVLDLPKHDNVHLVHRAFLDPMNDLPNFDKIFCLSVLEDLTDSLEDVLKKFKSKLNPNGLLVVTFDTPYDSKKPTPVYPGLDLNTWFFTARKAGFLSDVIVKNGDLVCHSDWNLAVCHFVLSNENS